MDITYLDYNGPSPAKDDAQTSVDKFTLNEEGLLSCDVIEQCSREAEITVNHIVIDDPEIFDNSTVREVSVSDLIVKSDEVIAVDMAKST